MSQNITGATYRRQQWATQMGRALAKIARASASIESMDSNVDAPSIKELELQIDASIGQLVSGFAQQANGDLSHGD